MKKSKRENNTLISILLGAILFFLVLSVIYMMILISGTMNFSSLQIFMPIVVFSGFFIFLIGAILIALSLFKRIVGFH